MVTTSLADAKNRLSELVRSAETTHERTIITKNGHPVAALVAIADLESMEETLEILSDPQLVAEIAHAQAELAAGLGEIYTKEQLLAMIAGQAESSD